MPKQRGRRKEKWGIVVGDGMDKTITVRVEQLYRHSRYDRILKKFTKFKAHDEKNEARTGDRVLIRESRPLSRTKRWRLVKVERVD